MTIEYKNIGGICITPCPIFAEIKVGSATCTQCQMFAHQDRLRHKIYCKGNPDTIELIETCLASHKLKNQTIY